MPDIPVTYRTPFGLGPVAALDLSEHLTLLQMAERMPGLPPEFMAEGIICINGYPVDRAHWHCIRPKAATVTEVTFHAHLMGGDDGGKNVLALVASIALLGAVGWVTGGGLAGKTLAGLTFGADAFAAGGIGAQLAGAGLALAGQALIGGLAPAPGVPGQGAMDAARSAGVASADGNVLSPNGAAPRVIGTRKVFPPFACQPLVYYDGEDEMVEAVYLLAGPHDLSDIRFGQASIGDMPGLAYEIREGWPGDARLALVTRQSLSDDVRSEMRGHVLREDGVSVDDTADGGYLPQPVALATRTEPDEFWIALNWPQGLHQNGDDKIRLRVPIRLRIRAVGTTSWSNLPEIHHVGVALREIRATIKLQWVDSPVVQVNAAAGAGFVEARKVSPGQTETPASADYTADASFGSGGDDYLAVGNLNSTGVENVVLSRHEAVITLDTATFPRGRYEIEIKRGAVVLDTTYDSADYEVSGTVWDLFGTQGAGIQSVVREQSDLAATLAVVRASNIWNEHPVQTDDFALIALRARNRQLGPLSVEASGYVRDWDGSAWSTWTTTSNPAPHLRDVYAGDLNANPVPVDILDEDDLVAWRTECAVQGYEINSIVEGGTVDSAARLVAAAGFSAVRQSNTWGVVIGKDTSADDPVYIFTPANSRGFSFSRAFPETPDGIRAVFRDRGRDYAERQIVVPDSAVGGLLIQREYEEVTEAEVRRRAAFDLGAQRKQATSYSLTVPPEAIAVRRGDLVGVEHDTLSEHTGQGRVVGWTKSGGNLTGVTLDSTVPITNEPDMHAVADLHAVADMRAVGITSGMVLRLADGTTELHTLSNATGQPDTLTLATPATSGVAEDLLVIVGPVGREYDRLLVSDVTPQDEFSAQLTFIDEAPELWA